MDTEFGNRHVSNSVGTRYLLRKNIHDGVNLDYLVLRADSGSVLSNAVLQGIPLGFGNTRSSGQQRRPHMVPM